VIYLSGDYHEKGRQRNGGRMDHKTGTGVREEKQKRAMKKIYSQGKGVVKMRFPTLHFNIPPPEGSARN
jgi:hypothetical protein